MAVSLPATRLPALEKSFHNWLLMVRGHLHGEGWIRCCLIVEAPSPPWQRLESLKNRPQRGSLPLPPLSSPHQASPSLKPARGSFSLLPYPELGLTYNFDNQSLDAAFTNIQDLDRLVAHPQSTVRFSDIPVNSQGEFESGLTGNRIQGSFYGPGHAEAAGIFEQSNIVGAFVAKKEATRLV